MENHKLIETLQNDLKVTTNKDINDTLLFSLKLLHSLTRNMNESMCIIVKHEVSNTSFYIHLFKVIFRRYSQRFI